MTNNIQKYNTLIIGGGIVGAGIFRDLALHGDHCLLIDKNDFTSQTSQSSSKMLHGGIRYLENYDFLLVKEALHEKNLWLKLLPHLAKERPFVLPIYNDSKHSLWMLKIGLFLYDFLSGFQNSPHEILNKEKTIKNRPLLNSKNLKGSGLYYDGLMDDIKITLEVIYDGLKSPNARALNHTEFLSIDELSDGTKRVELRNNLSGETFTVECQNVIFSVGPFTDKIMEKAYPNLWKEQLLPSKGSHFWISKKRLPINAPFVINHKDGRVIFFIPHQEMVLVGTTEEDIKGDFENLSPSQDETNYLLGIINEYLPGLEIGRDDIDSWFSGVRPLVKDSSGDKGKTSRSHRYYQIKPNTFVITGGKYTTFRVMGQEISRQIIERSGGSYSSFRSMNDLRQKSVILPFQKWNPNIEDITRILKQEMPKNFEDLLYRRIGVYSKRIWKERYPEISFEDFFKENLPELNKFIEVTAEEISNFREL